MPQTTQAKKLVLVSTISKLVTSAKKAQVVRVLDQVSYICYPVQFRKNKSKGDILALINFNIKINAMTPTYTVKLALKVQKTDVGT